MKAKIYKQLLEFISGYKKDIVIVLFSIVTVSISLLFIGILIKDFIDNGIKLYDVNSLNHNALLMSAIILIFSISSFLRSYFINNLAEKVINKIKINTYKNTLQLSITQFEDLKIGDIVSRFDSDLNLVSKLINNLLSFFIRNSIMLIGAIVLMFCQSIKLSLLVILVIPSFLIPLLKLGKFVSNLSKKSLELKGSITSDIVETFSNIRTIQAFNKESDKIKFFEDSIDNDFKLTEKRLKIRSLFFALAICIILTSIVFIIWCGSRGIVENTITSGQMTSFIYYSIIASMSASSIAELFTELQSPLQAAERIFELMNLFKVNQYTDKNYNPVANINIPNNLEFNNISFSYPSRPDIKVLKNVSFNINNGGFIGIVGKSGSGKSTIMQLLLKFYIATDGVIKINNYDLLKLDTKNVRNLISYVPQDTGIFAGSIRSNIVFSKPNASEEEIQKVLDLTGLKSFISELENGLSTEIGERGVKLSGGQKQRIAIARALLISPKILLLDEATSGLDFESEKILLEAIKNEMKNKILISIAHRTSSIMDADEILVIDNGVLVRRGKHSSLLKHCLYYQYICNEQLRTSSYLEVVS